MNIATGVFCAQVGPVHGNERTAMLFSRIATLCLALVPAVSLAAGGGTRITAPDLPYTWTAPALPKRKGRVVRCSTVAELRAALNGAVKDVIVLLADGTYKLNRGLILNGARNVTIRSASGDRNKVTLKGIGMAHKPGRPKYSAIQWSAKSSGLILADLTIRDFPYHGIHVSGDNVHIRNCRFVDMGQQLIKVNAVGALRPEIGVVEYCLVEYTDRLWGGNYTQGISIVRGKNWVLRHNVFRNIRGAKGAGMGGPAVLIWGGTEGATVVGNVVVDCDSGIAFGIGKNRRGEFHVKDGVIAGNVVVRTTAEPASDHGIAIAHSRNVRIAYNTVWNAVPRNGIRWSVEYRFDCRDLLFANNLTLMPIQKRNGTHANIRLEGNVVSADATLFRDLKKNDLHLARRAGTAVTLRKGALSGAVDVDGDLISRKNSSVGADQTPAVK
jgi:hypothetical protein